ncbi:MAG: hypothetical protein JJU46_10810 [Balneolaceae bacterium]|nr:hypothetical protein [Balneolaceae bacterium]MCH8547999.1 hypothetical protein [Balneolaceae bacterium]
MHTQIKLIFAIQAIGAFFLLAALFYFALGISGLRSFGLSLLATSLIGFWGYFRFSRYRKKKEGEKGSG